MPRKLKARPQRQGKKRRCQEGGNSGQEDEDREKSESDHALAMTTATASKWLDILDGKVRAFGVPLRGVEQSTSPANFGLECGLHSKSFGVPNAQYVSMSCLVIPKWINSSEGCSIKLVFV